MEQHVLLVVDDEAADVARRRPPRDAGAIACQTGTIAKTGPPGDVVRRLRVRLHRRLGHLVPVLLSGRPIAARSKLASSVQEGGWGASASPVIAIPVFQAT